MNFLTNLLQNKKDITLAPQAQKIFHAFQQASHLNTTTKDQLLKE
ncbi:MAG: hypothetical protein Q8784_02285 [Vigna little leaf phytoplasma]|nr:hypothetical protein [Vigna little leaf phytoplasma]